MKKISIFYIFVLMLILPSCRTASVSPAWGICGYEDPVNECEWMQEIIRQYRTKRLVIAEVIAEKCLYDKEGNLIKKEDDHIYAYQIYCEAYINCKDCFLVDTYDCNGVLIDNAQYSIGTGFDMFDENLSESYFYYCRIIDVNTIYEQK